MKIQDACILHFTFHISPRDNEASLNNSESLLQHHYLVPLKHFRVEIFIALIDLQLGELDEQFDEVITEFLICMTCLNSTNCFSSFDKEKIIKLEMFYPSELTSTDLIALDCLLDVYIEDMRIDVRFRDLHDLGALSMMLVKTKKHMAYPDIYLLIKLVFILRIATVIVERVFSGMTCVKTRQLNDSLVTIVEKDVFLQISDDVVIDRNQNMKTQRTRL